MRRVRVPGAVFHQKSGVRLLTCQGHRARLAAQSPADGWIRFPPELAANAPAARVLLEEERPDMDETTCDLLVVGGGLTGLIAGLRCAEQAFRHRARRARPARRSHRDPNGDRRKRRHMVRFRRPFHRQGPAAGKHLETRDRGTGARCLRAVRGPKERAHRRPPGRGRPRTSSPSRRGRISRSSLTWDRSTPVTWGRTW